MSKTSVQQLIDDLQQRGIDAGHKQSEALISKADQKAEEMLASARLEAQTILDAARAEAEQMKRRMEAELKGAAIAGLEAFRQAVEGALLIPTVNAAIAPLFADRSAFVELLVRAVEAFAQSAAQRADLEVLLSPQDKAWLQDSFVAELERRLGEGVDVRFEPGFAEQGFHLNFRSEGYRIDFSHGALREVLLALVTPHFRAAFFKTEEA